MGAEMFETIAKGKTAEEAFQRAVEAARYEYGHGGYTGTIAEKRSFKVFPVPDGMSPLAFVRAVGDSGGLDRGLPAAARRLVEEARRVYEDKWGPAVAVNLGPDEWLFCGWASS